MRYFVIAPDGTKFGPADLDTLRAWVTQGRISPETILEEEASRQRVPARMVAGLTFLEVSAYSRPSGRSPKTEYLRGGDTGSMDLMWSYLCSVLSIVCCGFFIIGGFVYANRAKAKGNPGGTFAFWFAVFFLFVWIGTTILEIAFFQQLKDMIAPKMGLG